MIHFGERVRQLRRSQDITQNELAAQLGVGPSSVGKYETANAYPSVDVLVKLSDIFNVSIDYLLRGREYHANTQDIENNIGSMSNSPFIQANHGGVVFSGEKSISQEASELLRIYESLNVKDRVQLLNRAFELDGEQKE